MKFPPAVIDIRRAGDGGKNLRLCLPAFLLWPFAVILLTVLIPALVVIGILYPFADSVRRFFQRIYAGIVFCCSLRGLNVVIEKETRVTRINII